jgi:DNA-binding XRE family transcriptional regulator
MSDPNSPAAPDESASKAITILGARPPVPPQPSDPTWTWTAQKLKAVYLEAFTDIQKKQIAELVGVSTQTIFNWRKQGDYKRYMAELVYSDGVAETVQRNKTRKTVADALLVQIMNKLSTPGALAGEKVSAMIKTLNDLLISIGEDVAAWDKITEAAQAGKPTRQDGADVADYIRHIEDPEEREALRRHMLAIFKAQIDGQPAPRATRIIDAEAIQPDQTAAPVLDTNNAISDSAPEAPPELDISELE